MKKPIRILLKVFGVLAALLVLAFMVFRHIMLPTPYKTNYDKLIRQSGGYAALRSECVALLPELTNAPTPLRGTNLPPLIASLNPQYVAFRETSPEGVNIILSGGFFHACIYVVLDEHDNSYVSMGSIFTKKKLSDGVYLFKE